MGDVRAGRLVDAEDGSPGDTDPELYARDAGIDGAAASAEEAAVHVIRAPVVEGRRGRGVRRRRAAGERWDRLHV